MLLEDKNAVIYGGAGSIGGAVARAFAAEGARVFLAGRSEATLDKLAGEIRGGGGLAETAVVDALDERSVDEHADAVAAQAGSIDVSLSVISHRSMHGTPLAEMAVEDFTDEIETSVGNTPEVMGVTAAMPHRERVCGLAGGVRGQLLGNLAEPAGVGVGARRAGASGRAERTPSPVGALAAGARAAARA